MTMFNLVDILKPAMVGKEFKLRSIKKTKARFLCHDEDTNQDIIAVLYFDVEFDAALLHGVMFFRELTDLHEHDRRVRLRCEVRQL